MNLTEIEFTEMNSGNKTDLSNIDLSGIRFVEERKQEQKWNKIMEEAKQIFMLCISICLIAIFILFLCGAESIIDLLLQ